MVRLLHIISTFLPQDACRRHVLIHGCKKFRARELRGSEGGLQGAQTHARQQLLCSSWHTQLCGHSLCLPLPLCPIAFSVPAPNRPGVPSPCKPTPTAFLHRYLMRIVFIPVPIATAFTTMVVRTHCTERKCVRVIFVNDFLVVTWRVTVHIV